MNNIYAVAVPTAHTSYDEFKEHNKIAIGWPTIPFQDILHVLTILPHNYRDYAKYLKKRFLTADDKNLHAGHIAAYARLLRLRPNDLVVPFVGRTPVGVIRVGGSIRYTRLSDTNYAHSIVGDHVFADLVPRSGTVNELRALQTKPYGITSMEEFEVPEYLYARLRNLTHP